MRQCCSAETGNLSEQELDPVHGIGETGFTDHNLKKNYSLGCLARCQRQGGVGCWTIDKPNLDGGVPPRRPVPGQTDEAATHVNREITLPAHDCE